MVKLKNLEWKRTAFNIINKDRNPIDTQTWEAITPLRKYKVYHSVGGAYFYQWDSMSHDKYNPILGGIFYSGADDILGKPKIKCKSIEEGKHFCQENWSQLGNQVLSQILK